MANSDNKAFNMMTAAVDESRVDISGYDILPEIPKGSVVSKSDERLSVGQIKANKSFDTFIKRLGNHRSFADGNLSKTQIAKLKEFWVAGGTPIIKIHKMGEEGFAGDKDRAYFTRLPINRMRDENKHVDKIGIFPDTLFEDFLAELGHSFKSAKKEGESKKDWISRRARISSASKTEYGQYGRDRYGKTDASGKKFFPTEKFEYFEIGTKDGKEIIVDDKGNEYPNMEVPKDFGTGRTLAWGRHTPQWTEFDPETRLGVEGQSLTGEFEAHEVVEDSLWNVYNRLYE